MAARGARSEKVKRIFLEFDTNKDGGLNREEMAALVVAVNARVKFSDEQINAIIDEVFRTYDEFIDGDEGLNFDGLLRTYDDGAGDVDRDFEALDLDLIDEDDNETAEAAALSIVHDRTLDPQKNHRTAACAASPSHGIVFDDTWKFVVDLEIMVKRLKAKQTIDGKSKNDNSDAYSDAGCSIELGPSSELFENNKRIVWAESGHDYAVFVKDLGILRSRADGARSREQTFDGHMAIGRVLYEQQLFKDALVSFKRACELLPLDVRPHFRAGNCLYVLGRYDEAKKEFQLAVEAAETGENQWVYLLPQIHVNLGIVLEAQGMVLSACEHYREAAILCPTHYRALKLLGSALFGVGENRAAVKALEEAISMKPDYADAHCDFASALHALGDDERAIVEFQKAIDLKPGHVEALYNLGGLYLDIGRYQRASEMYTRVLVLCPNHWQAQLNKAVSLLGAGETDEAKKAMKEAFNMTKRVEANGVAYGEATSVVVGALKFKTVNERTTYRPDLANALEVRAFQKISRFGRCDVELLKREINGSDVPMSFSDAGVPEKSMRKDALEAVLRRLLCFLKPMTFQEAVKAVNERILSVLDESSLGRVDIGMGPPVKRKQVAFEALLWRPVNEGNSHLQKVDAARYIKLLRSIYFPAHGIIEMPDIHGEADASTVSLNDFLLMLDDPEWGFGVMSTLVSLENGDRTRHGSHVCSVCRYPILGSRFKEINSGFNLCNQCYSEGKVPSAATLEGYTFKEYGTELHLVQQLALADFQLFPRFTNCFPHNLIHRLILVILFFGESGEGRGKRKREPKQSKVSADFPVKPCLTIPEIQISPADQKSEFPTTKISTMFNNSISISVSDEDSDELAAGRVRVRVRRKRKKWALRSNADLIRRFVRMFAKWWPLSLFFLALGLLLFEASRISQKPTSDEMKSRILNPRFDGVEKKPMANLNRLDPTTRVVRGVRERCLKLLPLEELQHLDVPVDEEPTNPVKNVVYISEYNPLPGGNSTFSEQNREAGRFNLFTGYQTANQREKSFKLSESPMVHCGFFSENGGFKISDEDKGYLQTCKVVVSTCAFGGGDDLYQPIGMSETSVQKVCYVAFWDEITVTVQESRGQKIAEDHHIGNWRIVVVRDLPFADQRLNGKIPKMLGHRLFPHARYSIWVDSKSQFRRDPLGVLEALLWRSKSVLAISEHGARSSMYDEAKAVVHKHKATPEEVEVQTTQYRLDGLPEDKRFNGKKALCEASIIVRKHAPLTNLFMCLWFNEVVRFTSRDQLSFPYVLWRLEVLKDINLFPVCTRKDLVNSMGHIGKAKPLEI
ncbi:hypothetical protein Nepgr_018529 [Nepenthes gracilis]|uniref:EF-hand domain-containing protein n=1 Tax=Nepenthes gracilis TaxID=150966 RepID=A0AAD3SSF0_NEPGR|nr:hypothetical protein Nepgr_018529 [Nepenthes gracilis]